MDFEERYRTGNTGWEINRVDSNLVAVVSTTPISPCKVLDIGCGTGDNAIWLQKQGFTVTGIDISKLAIEAAEKKAKVANVDCSCFIGDFFKDTISEAPFGFIFDRGCFHHPPKDENLHLFAKNVFDSLSENGLWLTLAGSCDQKRNGEGPPQITGTQIVKAVEPMFEILTLKTGFFDSDHKPKMKSWICLMKKRQA